MILGIGTALPIGIVGGLFHMINNAMYKSCLFLTGGAVEKQAGTTDLREARRARRARCRSRSSASSSRPCPSPACRRSTGSSPRNWSTTRRSNAERDLLRWRRSLGSFFTAASFLKLGHAAFLGQRDAGPRQREGSARCSMLLPMIVIAGAVRALRRLQLRCRWSSLIQPVLGAQAHGHTFAGWPAEHAADGADGDVAGWRAGQPPAGRAASTVGGAGARWTTSTMPRCLRADLRPAPRTGAFDPYDLGHGTIARSCRRPRWRLDRGIDWRLRRRSWSAWPRPAQRDWCARRTRATTRSTSSGSLAGAVAVHLLSGATVIIRGARHSCFLVHSVAPLAVLV